MQETLETIISTFSSRRRIPGKNIQLFDRYD